LNVTFGVYQTDKLVNNSVAIKFVDSNFSNAFFIKLSSGSFYV
jgi:hypothetical protein